MIKINTEQSKKCRKKMERPNSRERKRVYSAPTQMSDVISNIFEIPVSPTTQQRLLLVFKEGDKKHALNQTTQTEKIIISSHKPLATRGCQTKFTRRKIEITSRGNSPICLIPRNEPIYKRNNSNDTCQKSANEVIKASDIVILKEAITLSNNSTSVEENSSFSRLICWHQPQKILDYSENQELLKDGYYIVVTFGDPRISPFTEASKPFSGYLHYVTNILDPTPNDLIHIYTIYPMVLPSDRESDKRVPRIYKITKANAENYLSAYNNLYYLIPQIKSHFQDQKDLYRIEPIIKTVINVNGHKLNSPSFI